MSNDAGVPSSQTEEERKARHAGINFPILHMCNINIIIIYQIMIKSKQYMHVPAHRNTSNSSDAKMVTHLGGSNDDDV